MDFISELARTKKGNDVIWITVYILTKSAQFIPMKTTKLTKLYIYLKLSDCLVCQHLLCLIETEGSTRDFGKVYKRLWD